MMMLTLFPFLLISYVSGYDAPISPLSLSAASDGIGRLSVNWYAGNGASSALGEALPLMSSYDIDMRLLKSGAEWTIAARNLRGVGTGLRGGAGIQSLSSLSTNTLDGYFRLSARGVVTGSSDFTPSMTARISEDASAEDIELALNTLPALIIGGWAPGITVLRENGFEPVSKAPRISWLITFAPGVSSSPPLLHVAEVIGPTMNVILVDAGGLNSVCDTESGGADTLTSGSSIAANALRSTSFDMPTSRETIAIIAHNIPCQYTITGLITGQTYEVRIRATPNGQWTTAITTTVSSSLHHNRIPFPPVITARHMDGVTLTIDIPIDSQKRDAVESMINFENFENFDFIFELQKSVSGHEFQPLSAIDAKAIALIDDNDGDDGGKLLRVSMHVVIEIDEGKKSYAIRARARAASVKNEGILSLISQEGIYPFWSTPVEGVAPLPSLPSPPTLETVTRADIRSRSVTLRWTAPASLAPILTAPGTLLPETIAAFALQTRLVSRVIAGSLASNDAREAETGVWRPVQVRASGLRGATLSILAMHPSNTSSDSYDDGDNNYNDKGGFGAGDAYGGGGVITVDCGDASDWDRLAMLHAADALDAAARDGYADGTSYITTQSRAAAVVPSIYLLKGITTKRDCSYSLALPPQLSPLSLYEFRVANIILMGGSIDDDIILQPLPTLPPTYIPESTSPLPHTVSDSQSQTPSNSGTSSTTNTEILGQPSISPSTSSSPSLSSIASSSVSATNSITASASATSSASATMSASSTSSASSSASTSADPNKNDTITGVDTVIIDRGGGADASLPPMPHLPRIAPRVLRSDFSLPSSRVRLRGEPRNLLSTQDADLNGPAMGGGSGVLALASVEDEIAVNVDLKSAQCGGPTSSSFYTSSASNGAHVLSEIAWSNGIGAGAKSAVQKRGGNGRVDLAIFNEIPSASISIGAVPLRGWSIITENPSSPLVTNDIESGAKKLILPLGQNGYSIIVPTQISFKSILRVRAWGGGGGCGCTLSPT